jgi:hypothetical protein
MHTPAEYFLPVGHAEIGTVMLGRDPDVAHSPIVDVPAANYRAL